MFELKCFEYLKEIKENPQNTKLYNEFTAFLMDNEDAIEEFIVRNSLQSDEKEILLHAMQESRELKENPPPKALLSQINMHNMSVSTPEEFSDLVVRVFEEWKTEYFALREVTPKCVSLVQELIQEIIFKHFEYLDILINLSIEHNDAFLKFKNNVLNNTAILLVQSIDTEIDTIRTLRGNYFSRVMLIYQLEQQQQHLFKKKFNISKIQEIIAKANTLKGAV